MRVKTTNGSPVPTTCPGVTKVRTVHTASGAVSTCCIFIASSTTNCAPRRELGAFRRYLDHGAGQLCAQHLLTRIQFERRDSGLMAPRLRSTDKVGQVFVNEACGDRT